MTDQKGDLLFSLPDSVRFIQGAIDSGGQVLVHANDPFTAAGIICAYCKLHATCRGSLGR